MDKHILERLEKAGLVLPPALPAKGLYHSVVETNGELYVSGLGPIVDGKPLTGVVGQDIDLPNAKHAARITALLILAAVEQYCGLQNILRCTRMTVYVKADERFVRHPEVADGASEVLRDVFGENLLPARSAIGVYTLPFAIPVEIDSVFQLKC
ncbi:RidA family protein [Pseudomonas sp. UBA1879]|uniref:RidA family protein n=1 Tax=Pseudomonas sp. UBA1879 TaxID=1947305 RepID=UPI0025FA1B7D|nr:RidA family protein [Pseudomonas sp. UBA1879]